MAVVGTPGWCLRVKCWVRGIFSRATDADVESLCLPSPQQATGRDRCNPPPPYKNMRVFLFICVFLFLRVLIWETPMCSVPSPLILQKYGRVEC